MGYAQEDIKPYDANAPKGEQVERMFDHIAPKYDLLNHLLSFGIDRGWRRKTICHAGLPAVAAAESGGHGCVGGYDGCGT